MEAKEYTQMMDTYSGVTEHNYAEVQEKLAALRMIPLNEPDERAQAE